MDTLRLPPLKRLQPAHWVAIDCVLAILLTLVYTGTFKEPSYQGGIPRWAIPVLLALAVLPTALRRRWPRSVLGFVVVIGAVVTAFSTSPGPPLAVAFVMYLIPQRFPRREAARLLAVTLFMSAVGLAGFGFFGHGIYGSGGIATATGQLLEASVLIAAAWMIGDSVRRQHTYTSGLQEDTERRAEAQIAEVRRASSEERLEIARELHDVVAHSMSLIAVQAGVANYVVNERPEEAARALSSIEQTSRSALLEMRALLEVLRSPGNRALPRPRDPELIPAPGMANLDNLVEQATYVGVHVDLGQRGQPSVLSPGLDLAAYRVIQEAITNVIKHAVTDRCRVTVTYEKDTLKLEITDDGVGACGNGEKQPTVGHGIAGMSERVAMYGGLLRAGPLPRRGFQVTARFPLTGTPL